MRFIWIFIFQLTFRHCSLENSRFSFNIYQSDRLFLATNDIDDYYDCLYYTAYDSVIDYTILDPGEKLTDNEKLNPPEHMITYCMRSLYNKPSQLMSNQIRPIGIPFKQLKEKHVRSEDMLKWSAPIDLVERYEEFLSKNILPIAAEELFYNCTAPWFGSSCQYTFDFHSSNFSFNDIVRESFMGKARSLIDDIRNYINVTCYTHIKCNRIGGECLDWREICDGKNDCLDSVEDEKNCLELEINDCADEEYRCYNGMCISDSFLRDDPFNPECLDGSDERKMVMTQFSDCFLYPSFRCEERTCLNTIKNFPCGDGECSSIFLSPFRLVMSHMPCNNNRGKNAEDWFLLYDKNMTISFDCWSLMVCLLNEKILTCSKICTNKKTCWERVKYNCSLDFLFPVYPVFDGHVRYGFSTNLKIETDGGNIVPHYVCFDEKRCPFLPKDKYIDGYSCFEWKYFDKGRYKTIPELFHTCLTIDASLSSNNSKYYLSLYLYNCPATLKYISKHRIVDGVIDCFENHDELHNESCFFHDKHRVNCSQDSDYCIKISAILNNKLIHCGTDLLNFNSYNYEIAFPTLCNSYLQINDLLGLSKDQETDENHCEWWPCNNQYTRCDTSWTCVNGADEWNCPQSTCPYNHMPCISPNTFTKFCLNISRIGDNIQDCLGATDEQAFCRSVFPLMDWRYKCWDSPVCTPIYFRPLPDYLCLDEKINETEADALLPLSSFWLRNPTYSNFGLESLPLTVTSKSFEQSRLSLKEIENPDFHLLPRISSSETDNVTSKLGPCEAWLCNRGILILKELERKEYCLCPQSYYGDRCQYQSDRVSITLQFRRQTIPENIQEVFSFVVNLFDNNDVIHSSDYFTYLPKSSCNTKFNRYLLYDSPAKDKTKNYTVRIDSYNRIDPTHYASWLLPIKFPFLPVYRIAFHLTLPMKQSVMVRECPMSCVHGYCTKYINQLEQSYYCQCYSGWSGSRCTVLLNCNCSNGSFCVGVTRNRAICVCPLRKLGPRCFLQSVCYTDTCKNGGVCVPTDERISSHPSFTCMCSKGFWGFNCELKETKIVISFSKEIDIPQSIIVHFITVNKKADPTRITTLKKVPSVVNEVTLLVAKPFNLLFAQIQSNFYLTYLQKNSTLTSSGIIFGEISVSRQCFHIRQLFDDNVTTTYPLLRRVKYYHIPCDKRPDLSCFYDEEQFMCLCNEHHHANCFKFDFNITYNCWGRSECQNGAACYQDDPNCPTETLCVCPECYYGSKCQLSTNGLTLSLDAILGYQIEPHLSIFRQRSSIKLSIGVTTFMLVIGLIFNTLFLLTFLLGNLREVGSGIYLLVIAINSILILCVFTYKFWFLLLAQMSIIVNRELLFINCVAVDFIIQFLLASGDWLNACVAIERAIIVLKGIKFDKKKSKRMARRIIFVLILIIIGTFIHDPIHRQVIYDQEEERHWCIVKYTSSIQIINSIITITHFIGPFIINFISAVTIIISIARQHSTTRQQRSYKEHLFQQFHQHKHLIISPLILVLLSLPRPIISFFTGCMKSARDPWLFLSSYFISFIPPLLISLIYILPSETYKKAFDEVIIQGIRRYIIFRHRSQTIIHMKSDGE